MKKKRRNSKSKSPAAPTKSQMLDKLVQCVRNQAASAMRKGATVKEVDAAVRKGLGL